MPQFYCSKCGAHLQVRDSHTGEKGNCPRCQASIPVPVSGANRPASELTCPRCRTNDIRRCEIVHKMGTTEFVGEAQIGGGIRAKAAGIQQSDLARIAAPPEPPAVPPPLAALIPLTVVTTVGFAWLTYYVSNSFAACLLLPIAVGGIVLSIAALFFFIFAATAPSRIDPAEYPRLRREWEKKYMCLRCGAIFTPKSPSHP